MSTVASKHPDLAPEEVRQLSEQAVGRVDTCTEQCRFNLHGPQTATDPTASIGGTRA
ncbi:hypothetical protein [Streptomyces fodineus]|uniref:hypothetical protein n=1 Tax=Streptomyces fodineus TaxID=1904616 RepID=UPI00131B5187|nr:hypothetical protein [Streptomyces fodineus]